MVTSGCDMSWDNFHFRQQQSHIHSLHLRSSCQDNVKGTHPFISFSHYLFSYKFIVIALSLHQSRQNWRSDGPVRGSCLLVTFFFPCISFGATKFNTAIYQLLLLNGKPFGLLSLVPTQFGPLELGQSTFHSVTFNALASVLWFNFNKTGTKLDFYRFKLWVGPFHLVILYWSGHWCVSLNTTSRLRVKMF